MELRLLESEKNRLCKQSDVLGKNYKRCNVSFMLIIMKIYGDKTQRTTCLL
jgi:hypothetical protein